MNPIRRRLLFGLCLALVGCAAEESGAVIETAVTENAASETVPQRQAPAPEAKQVKVGNNVVLEVEGDKRRVLVNSIVCLRQGQLEQFLTRRRTKEHEAVLAAEVDARDIHTALTLAGGEPGSPVKFRPEYAPARGTPIKVLVEYEKGGKKVRHPAQEWIRNIKTQKDLNIDWVFAGSLLIPDPTDPTRKPFYAANDGDVICLSNFETAMLDLPIKSTPENADLFFEAHTDRIPALQTPVTVILEPMKQAKKK